jgi:predicted AAA+ superfamily ATPase
VVFVHLDRLYNNVYFKKGKDEVDFFIPEENLNIQVCFQLNEQNFEREISPLLKQDGKKILIYFDMI